MGTAKPITGAAVSIRSLKKAYGPVTAVDDVSLEVGAGEFLALLGPSGSGKSTILMAIAGFETPTAGDILLDGQPITRLPPHRRGIGMVFQRYALFPHLTVAENIAYPLRRRGASRATIEAEVERALLMVSLDNFGARFPAQLSGGQQQRVALARALVFRPPLLLMDEPLGALDRKLRQQMQMELKLLHRDLGTTIILVTHDQDEALSMANRVAVLRDGRLEQVGAPQDLYQRPLSAFVAGFIGETNLLPVDVVERRTDAVVVRLRCTADVFAIPSANCLADGKEVMLSVRPEAVRLSPEGIPANVVETAYAGAMTSVLADVNGTRIAARTTDASQLSPGSPCRLAINGADCRLFPA